MFTNFLKITKRSYYTSLKDKKSKINLSKNLDKVIKQNESKIIREEIESIYEKINYGKLLIKLSLFTIVPTSAYLLYSNIKYSKKSKQLTDAYNIALNGLVTSTALFIGTFIGLNYKSYKKFNKEIKFIPIATGIVLFYLIIYQIHEADKMNLKHILPLFVSTTGLFTAEYLYGKNLPGWYLKCRLTIILCALIAFNYIVYSDVNGNSNFEKSLRLLNDYQTKSDEFKETPQLINKNYM